MTKLEDARALIKHIEDLNKRLTTSQLSFVNSIKIQLDKGFSISSKQIDVLCDIYRQLAAPNYIRHEIKIL